jgi:hypothetical protein
VSKDAGTGAITRLTVDVALDGRSELVTFSLRDGELVWSSTGGEPYVAAALRWLSESPSPEAPARISEPSPRVSRPPEPDVTPEAHAARNRLAEALDDVVTVLVRAGVGGADSLSVAESLERLRREAPLPTPGGLSRWLGRLKAALDGRDVVLVARLLEGATRVAEDLRQDKPSAEARRRVVAWMGASGELVGGVERISDRVLVEVAREQLASSERGGLERRHLVDLHDGEVFREERSRTSPVASVGPCPRVISVGLAEVEDGPAPRRIRLMQYAVSLELGAEELTRIESNAYRQFAALADRYRELVQAHPGQAEPFTVVAPRTYSSSGPVCHDDEGQPLPLARADDPAAIEVLDRVLPAGGPRWVAGRLVDVDGALMMVPCAVAVPEGDRVRFVRLR